MRLLSKIPTGDETEGGEEEDILAGKR